MKNFTNNFKQFTSRLSARWLIMALMLLLGTSSAWAANSDYYLRGGFNSWNTNNRFDDNGTCTISLPANTTYEFKIAKSDWNKEFTYTTKTITATSNNLSLSTTGSNAKITTNAAGSYVFTFSETGKTLSVTYPASCTPENPTFVHTNNSYSEINTPTYYLGDKAYFKSTIDCCLTGSWTKSGDGTYKTLSGNTPNFNLILSGVGSFTLTNNATDGCSGTTTPSISFTTLALPTPTSQSGTGSTTSATLNWTPNNTYKTVMVVRYAKDATVTAPTQGTAYTAGSSKIGNGTVVYKGTGTSYTNTGLTAGNSYDYYFYTVNNNYYSTSVKTTVSTCTSLTAPQLTITPITKCNTTYTSGKIVIEGYDATTYTYVLKKGADIVDKTYNVGYTIENGEEGDYTVVMDLKAGGSCKSVESTGSVNIVDNTPVVETLTMPKDFEACNGKSVTVALQNFTKEEGCSYQFTWQYSTDGGTSYTTGTVSNSATSYTRTLNGTTKFRVQVTKTKDGCTSPVATSEAVTVTANSLSAPTVSITSASYDMNAGTFTVSGRLDHAGCSESIYVGYRYKLSNDDNWSDLTNTHHLTEAGIFTKEDISIAGATAGQTYLFQTYAINGYPNYQETSAVLSSSTIEVEVQDGYTVYVRRPKSGDATNVYTNWYELSSVKGGAPYVKSGAISGSSSSNQATTNNTGGTEMTYAFTDCDGYIWDSFKPAKDDDKFYIHALNDIQQGGWGTFSKTANIEAGKDNYFYLSAWSTGTYGVTITKTNAPALGITIDALGSTKVISNNMASFAALYLKGNCSGKELKTDSKGVFTDQTFLWQYSTDGTSWGTYTGGDGATWNNIRPTQAGKYKLICTMEDDSQIESNIITITTTTENYDTDDLINITSNLPIFMVNTGGKGFPSCVNGSDFPTKHADALKKKRSVDVKIKVGNDIVYDRKARMNYRGSSSLNFKKKSYAFSSGQEYCGLDKDESPDYMKKGKMDMFSVITKGDTTSSEEKDWVLYAANPDPSMMRNILAIDTYKAMTGEWGVQNQYVELYVDGVYQGVYVFLDKITQGKKRINVKWDVDDASKRGFILKFDKTDVADRYEDATGDQKTFESDLTGASGIDTYGTQVDQRFEIEYPEKGDIEDDGGSWAEVKGFIEAKVNAFESALKDGKFNEVRNMIDYQSWADFFIINEFVKNVDAYRASCIFVYEDNKLKAYPLWDYELSFNNQAIGSGKGKADPTGLLIEHDDVYSDAFAAPFWWTGRYSNHIYKGLLDDPCFVSMIKTRWDMHANGEGALTQSKLQDLVDSYTTALTTTDATGTYNSPKARETKKWPYTYDSRGKADCNSGNTGYYAGWPDANKTQANDLTELTTWIGSGNTGRRDNLDGIIEEMASDISFSLSVVSDKSTTTPWRPVIITVSSNSGYEYTITPEAAQVKDNGNQHTVYLARPEGTEGTNFDTHAYTFTATSGETDQCGSSEPVSQSVKITLEDIEEKCP